MIVQISTDHLVLQDAIRESLYEALEGQFRNQCVLVLIPEHTRTLPLPLLFCSLVEVLHESKQLDFMAALGTHPPLSKQQLGTLVGITDEERNSQFSYVGLLNHAWNDQTALETIGVITHDEIKLNAGDCWHPSLSEDVPLRINIAVFDYDHILIFSPTCPHEGEGILYIPKAGELLY